MICPNGHVQPEGARFCGVCGARSPEIHDPAASGSPVGRRTMGATAAVVVGVVVLAILVGAGTAWLLTSNSEVDTTGADGASSTTTAATVPNTSASRTTPTQTGPTTAPSGSSSTSATTRSTEVPVSPPPPGGPTWITSLASVVDDDPAAAEQKYQELSAQYGDVFKIRTSEYASLTPGFIVIYRGPFSSGDAALEECFRLGRTTRHLCFAAPLSQSSADRDQRRYPD